MRSFRVARAPLPTLLAVRDGALPIAWAAHNSDELNGSAWESSNSMAGAFRGHHFRSGNRWVYITGTPTLTRKKVARWAQSCSPACFSTGSSGRSSGGRKRDHSLIYGAGWEGGGEDISVAVWWDFENCNVPQGIEVYKVGVNIVSGLRLSGFKGPVSISAYGDTVQLSRSTQEALASTGIRLHHIPSGGKDSSDRALLVDLILWTLEHPPPAHLFLISGDRDFSNALHRLRMRNYNILLACPAGSTVSPALIGAATHVWQWNSLVRGEGLLLVTSPEFRPPDGSGGGVSYPRYNGSKGFTPSFSSGARGQDGNGVSSDGGMGINPQPSPPSPALGMKTDVCQSSPLKQGMKDSTVTAKAQEEVRLESPTKPVLRQIPKKVLQQLESILISRPNGIMLGDLQSHISTGKLNLENDFYGHGKIMHFLASIPEVVQLERVLVKGTQTWTYRLKPTKGRPKSKVVESLTASENVDVTKVQVQQEVLQTSGSPINQHEALPQGAGESVQTPQSSTAVKQGKVDSSAPSESFSSKRKEPKKSTLMSSDLGAPPPTGQVELPSGAASRSRQLDYLPPNCREGRKQADGPSNELLSSSETAVSSAELRDDSSHQSASELSETPSFLGLFMNRLRQWQQKRRLEKSFQLVQQTDISYTEKHGFKVQDSDFEEVFLPADNMKEGSERQLKASEGDRTAEDDHRHLHDAGQSSTIQGPKASVDEIRSETSQGNLRDILWVERMGLDEGCKEKTDVISNGSTNESQSTPTSVQSSRKDVQGTWKRWLLGPAYEESLPSLGVAESTGQPVDSSTSSPDREQWSQFPLNQSKFTQSSGETKSSPILESTSEEFIVKTTAESVLLSEPPLTASKDDMGFDSHSSAATESHVTNCGGTTTLKKDLKEYLGSAEGTFLLSEAPNQSAVVHSIKTRGPLQFRNLDTTKLADMVELLMKENNGSDPDHTVQGVQDVDGKKIYQITRLLIQDTKNGVKQDIQSMEKDIMVKTKNSEGHTEQKKPENGTVTERKPDCEENSETSGRKESLDGQLVNRSRDAVSFTITNEANTMKSDTSLPFLNHSVGTSKLGRDSSIVEDDIQAPVQESSLSLTSTNGNPSTQPSFEEFEEWFVKVINNAYRRSVRVQKSGFDLSLVKPDFEREFGIRLDPKAYGFYRVQDLVASISSVRVSRPRVDQCVIHLLKFDDGMAEQSSWVAEENQGEIINSALDSNIWPQMYHDCKALVHELMLENPDGVPGIKLKPLFGSRYNYALDHKRMGYQRMSDLLRLMPDVVSVNGNFLVPSEELLQNHKIKIERAGKKSITNDEVSAGSCEDECKSKEFITIGHESKEDVMRREENSNDMGKWNGLDVEGKWIVSSEGMQKELCTGGSGSSNQLSGDVTDSEKLSTHAEVMKDVSSSSEFGSDSKTVGSGNENFSAQLIEVGSEDASLRKFKRRESLLLSGQEADTDHVGTLLAPSYNENIEAADEQYLDVQVEKWLADNQSEVEEFGPNQSGDLEDGVKKASSLGEEYPSEREPLMSGSIQYEDGAGGSAEVDLEGGLLSRSGVLLDQRRECNIEVEERNLFLSGSTRMDSGEVALSTEGDTEGPVAIEELSDTQSESKLCSYSKIVTSVPLSEEPTSADDKNIHNESEAATDFDDSSTENTECGRTAVSSSEVAASQEHMIEGMKKESTSSLEPIERPNKEVQEISTDQVSSSPEDLTVGSQGVKDKGSNGECSSSKRLVNTSGADPSTSQVPTKKSFWRRFFP